MKEILQTGIMGFWKNFEHLSEVTKRWPVTKIPWEYNGRETDENHFQASKGEKKKGLLVIALREDVLSPIMLPGRKEARGRETDLIILNQHSTWVLLACEQMKVSWRLHLFSLTPHRPCSDSQAMIRCTWKWKEDSHLHGFWQKEEHQNASPHFQPTSKQSGVEYRNRSYFWRFPMVTAAMEIIFFSGIFRYVSLASITV